MDLKKCNSRVVCPKGKLEFIILALECYWVPCIIHVSHDDKPNIAYILLEFICRGFGVKNIIK